MKSRKVIMRFGFRFGECPKCGEGKYQAWDYRFSETILGEVLIVRCPDCIWGFFTKTKDAK